MDPKIPVSSPRLKTRASKPTVAEVLAVTNCHRCYAFRAKLILMLEGASFNTIKRRLQISAPTIIHSKSTTSPAHKTQLLQDFLQRHPRMQFHFTPTYPS